MNDDTTQTIDITDAFDRRIRRLAFALDEATHLLLAQTKSQRCSDDLPSLSDLDGIQAVVDDAAGSLAAFDEHLEAVQRESGKDFSPPEFELEMTDEELAVVFPDGLNRERAAVTTSDFDSTDDRGKFDDELNPSRVGVTRDIINLEAGTKTDDPEILAELAERMEEGPYVHRSPTRNLGSHKHLPIDDLDPRKLDQDERWTSRVSDRGGRSIE